MAMVTGNVYTAFTAEIYLFVVVYMTNGNQTK